MSLQLDLNCVLAAWSAFTTVVHAVMKQQEVALFCTDTASVSRVITLTADQ